MAGKGGFDTNVGQFMGALGNISPGLQTDYSGAQGLYGIGLGSPIKNKKGKDIGWQYSPIALQGQLPQYKQDVNQGTAAINKWAPSAMSASENAMNMGLTTADMASGAVPGLYNLGGYFGGMGQNIAGMAPGVLNQADSVMSSQLAQMPQLQDYMTQALQQGFDPQKDLFNRQAMMMRDITGASNEAAGVAGSPYGAGVQNQGMENFLLDWQNQQLQRQATAAGTAGSLEGTIGGLTAPGAGLYNIGQNLAGTGANLATTGAGLDTSALGLGQDATQLANYAGQLPLQTSQTITQDKLGLQDALSQAKTNMYNQRTGGFNALNQFLGTAGSILQDVLTGQAQNFNMGQAQLTDMLGMAGLPFKMMGK